MSRRTRRIAAFAAAVTLALIGTVFALRQREVDNPYRPQAKPWWQTPFRRNSFAERRAIRSDILAVALNREDAIAGGTGGMLIWSDDAGETWHSAELPYFIPLGPGEAEPTPTPDSTRTDSLSDSTSSSTTSLVPLPAALPGREPARTMPEVVSAKGEAPGIATLWHWFAPSAISAQARQDPARRGQPVPRGPRGGTGVTREAQQAAGNTNAANPDTSAWIIAPATRPPDAARGKATSLYGAADVTGVALADSGRAFAVTNAGDLLVSTNSGKSWDYAMRRLPPLAQVVFANGRVGYVAGENVLLKTTDAGHSWTRLAIGSLAFQRISAVSQSHLRVLSGVAQINGSDDGGARWTAREADLAQVQVPFKSLRDIAFTTADTGWAALNSDGDSSLLFQTMDGGASWRRVGGPMPAMAALRASATRLHVFGRDGRALRCGMSGPRCTAVFTGPALRDLAMDSTSSHGIAVGDDGTILTTEDEGASWRVRSGGGDMLMGIDFSDRLNGWTVGTGGTVLTTDDGGASWTPRPAPTGRALNAVRALTRDIAVAVGADATILRTADGGRTWTPAQLDSVGIQRHPWPDFRDVDFVGGYGVTVGSRAAILESGDGGATWRARAGRSFLADVLAVRVVSEDQIWITDGEGRIWRLGRPGVEWIPSAATSPVPLNAIEVIGERVWAAGASGTLFMSRDTGKTWSTSFVAGSPYLTGIRFATRDTGWAVSREGSVFSTTNGGQDWTQARVDPDSIGLSGLAIVGGSAWAVGKGGKLLRSASGWGAVTRGNWWPAPWAFVAWAIALGLLIYAATRPPEKVPSIEEMLLSDRPIGMADRDVLGFKPVALAISRFLRNEATDPPLSLAITGPWGSGKSSLMNLIREDLRKCGARPVWFNAWHHQTEESLLAALLENVRAQAVPRAYTPVGFWFRLRLLWVRTRKLRPAAIFAVTVAALYAGYIAADTQRLQRVFDSVQAAGRDTRPTTFGGRAAALLAPFFPNEETGETPIIAVLGGLLVLAAFERSVKAFGVSPSALLATVVKSAKFKDLEAKTGFRHRFAEEFEEVTEALPRDLVIFVDDLDRCRPRQVLDVLEAINFLYSSGRCVIVMGMDPERVIRCVGLGFKGEVEDVIDLKVSPPPGLQKPADVSVEGSPEDKREEFAVQYLEKLVNIEVPVPRGEGRLPAIIYDDSADTAASRFRAAVADTARFGYRHRHTIRWAIVAIVLFFLGQWLFPRTSSTLPSSRPALASTAPRLQGELPVTVQDSSVPAATATAPSVPARYTDGRPLSTSKTVFVVAVILGVLMGVWRYFTKPDPVVRDSRDFIEALCAWAPFVARKRTTPRAMKKYLNRVRYYAMTQRPKDEPVTLLKRLRAMIIPHRPRVKHLKRQLSDTELVALASIYEDNPAAVEHPRTYTRFRQTVSQYIGDAAANGYPESLEPTPTMEAVRDMVSSIRVI
jgi:photosystem II stability/assembly factor-like uncharacterized protein